MSIGLELKGRYRRTRNTCHRCGTHKDPQPEMDGHQPSMITDKDSEQSLRRGTGSLSLGTAPLVSMELTQQQQQQQQTQNKANSHGEKQQQLSAADALQSAVDATRNLWLDATLLA